MREMPSLHLQPPTLPSKRYILERLGHLELDPKSILPGVGGKRSTLIGQTIVPKERLIMHYKPSITWLPQIIHSGASAQLWYFVTQFWHIPPTVGLILQLLCSPLGNRNFCKVTKHHDWADAPECKWMNEWRAGYSRTFVMHHTAKK